MPSLRFPDTGTRMAVYGTGRPAAGALSTVYADVACTVPAEIYLDVAGVKGALNVSSTITRDSFGQCADFWGPVDGTDRLYMVTNGAFAIVDADYNARLDAAESGLAALGTVDSGYDARLDALEAALLAAAVPALPAGRWRLSQGGGVVTGTHSLGFERAQLIRLAPGQLLSSIAISVTTAGAGSTVRLGARADGVNGLPGALLTDFGTVDTGSTGVKPLAISFTVPANTTARGMWVVAVAQGGVAPVLTCRSAAGSELDFSDSTIAATVPGAYNQSGVSGALPAGFTSPTLSGTATAIAVQGA